ncbi:hypothetical protein RHSIM_Rhsim07G0132600 [Rhododendron simsii]|uniref:Uncharacterized protein n=1 Tax=Rhododendron simsii TaxID=118357 RepID=A0A834GTK7_RHOSS|nr:hypothetical protein RHSIM_Rhsim07G0132600 [Rhododendron simsii]
MEITILAQPTSHKPFTPTNLPQRRQSKPSCHVSDVVRKHIKGIRNPNPSLLTLPKSILSKPTLLLSTISRLDNGLQDMINDQTTLRIKRMGEVGEVLWWRLG